MRDKWYRYFESSDGWVETILLVYLVFGIIPLIVIIIASNWHWLF